MINTIAVSKPEHGDQIVHGVLYSAKHSRNPAKLRIILSKYCHNSAKFLPLNDLLQQRTQY